MHIWKTLLLPVICKQFRLAKMFEPSDITISQMVDHCSKLISQRRRLNCVASNQYELLLSVNLFLSRLLLLRIQWRECTIEGKTFHGTMQEIVWLYVQNEDSLFKKHTGCIISTIHGYWNCFASVIIFLLVYFFHLIFLSVSFATCCSLLIPSVLKPSQFLISNLCKSMCVATREIARETERERESDGARIQ